MAAGQVAPVEPPKRTLPEDPAAREQARATVRPTVEGLLNAASGLLSKIPPGEPLAEWERELVKPPLEDVVWLYGGELSPEWSLVVAAGIIAIARFEAYKTARPSKFSGGDKPKDAPKVEAQLGDA